MIIMDPWSATILSVHGGAENPSIGQCKSSDFKRFHNLKIGMSHPLGTQYYTEGQIQLTHMELA